MRYLLIVILLSLGYQQGRAMDHFIHPTGGSDEQGNGSKKKPWATLQRVNNSKLKAGDGIYLAAGEIFPGSLVFDQADTGSARKPISVRPYGSSNAAPVIQPGPQQHGVYIYNTAGIDMEGILIDGRNRDAHEKSGIMAYVDLPEDDRRMKHIHISNCELTNCHTGITIAAWGYKNKKTYYSGFSNVLIEGCLVHHCRHDGITSWGISDSKAADYSHRNITVRDCEVHHVSGDPKHTNGHSGSGIILSATEGGLIERCYAHHNGGGGGKQSGGGPVGIWCWNAKQVTIRRCLVHDQKTIKGAMDGGGFDLDGGAKQCIIEQCYSYNNHGPGYLIAEYVGAAPLRDNIIRYNVSYNDGHKNRMGGVHFWNGKNDAHLLQGILIHNNLIVTGPASSGPVFRYQSGGIKNIECYNNIFVSGNGRPSLEIKSSRDAFLFKHNVWHAHKGKPGFTINKETVDTLVKDKPDTNMIGDPGLKALETLPSPQSIEALNTINAIRLRKDSICRDNGHMIDDPGPGDFFDTPIPQGDRCDIGPVEAP